jgi:hypothetical protein
MNRCPKYMIRPDDKEAFIAIKDGVYVLEQSMREWPNHLHHEYTYERLRMDDFEPDWSRENNTTQHD